MRHHRWLTLGLGSWLGVSVPTLFLAQAQPPADAAKKQEEVTSTNPQQALYTVAYDIRELTDKPEVAKHLRFFGHTSGAKPGAGNPRAQKAALVIGALAATVDGGKPKTADLDAIQVLNGTRLEIRTDAARHARIASMLDALRHVADVAVIVKARLYEIDEASYNKLKNAKSIPSEEAERLFVEGKLPRNALFDRLQKQKHVVAGEEFKVDSGRAGTLLSWHKAAFCLPSPDQLRKGDKSRQIVMEGVSFDGVIHVSPDRRYVRMDLTEQYTQVGDIQKVKGWWVPPAADERAGIAEQQMDAESPLVNKAAHTKRIEIPDGGSILVPVHYRPASAQADKQRWVLMITPRIYIEAEERAIRLGNVPPTPKKE